MDELRKWRETALSYVRFKPDREAIDRELREHMEDHAADLERIGFTAEEAQTRVLAAMGDPAETGRALDREHSPVLGWLWVLSKWLLLFAVLSLVVDVFILEASIFKFRDLLPPQWPQEDPVEFVELMGRQQVWEQDPYWQFIACGVSDTQAKTEDYTLAAPQWSLWKSTDGKFVRVYLVLTVDYDYLGPLDDVEFTDGLRFRCPEGEINNSRNWKWLYRGGTPVPHVSIGKGSLSQSLTKECFRLDMTLRTVPEWVEIDYPYGSNDWVLRVEMEGAS